MNRRLLLVLPVLASLSALAPSALAQLKPPAQNLQAVQDPTMVILDRGSKLEVLATQRAAPEQVGRRVIHRVQRAAAGAQLSNNSLGVVFNHAMQQQGYTTGEIAFQMKAGASPSGPAAIWPGLKKLNGGTYLVRARTPAEIVSLTKRLQGDAHVAWVEPVVVYSPLTP